MTRTTKSSVKKPIALSTALIGLVDIFISAGAIILILLLLFTQQSARLERVPKADAMVYCPPADTGTETFYVLDDSVWNSIRSDQKLFLDWLIVQAAPYGMDMRIVILFSSSAHFCKNSVKNWIDELNRKHGDGNQNLPYFMTDTQPYVGNQLPTAHIPQPFVQ